MQKILLIALLSLNLAMFASEDSSSGKKESDAKELIARQQAGIGSCFYRHFLDLSHVTPSNTQLAAYASCYSKLYKDYRTERKAYDKCQADALINCEKQFNSAYQQQDPKNNEKIFRCNLFSCQVAGRKLWQRQRDLSDSVSKSVTSNAVEYRKELGWYSVLYCQRVSKSDSEVTTSCQEHDAEEVDPAVPGCLKWDTKPASSSYFDNLALLHEVQQKAEKQVDDAEKK